MIELSISGRSEGLAASSNISILSIRDGSITELLANRLVNESQIALPFRVLGIWVEALSHIDTRRDPGAVSVKSVTRLTRHRSGGSQKLFELTIGNSFYCLSSGDKAAAIARAFTQVASAIAQEFPDHNGLALARLISDSVVEYANVSGAGPNNSFKPSPLRGPA